METTTEIVQSDNLPCSSYKTATFILLAVLLMFLPFVFLVLFKCYKKKQRPRRRIQRNGVITIGRSTTQRRKKVGKP